MTSAAHIFVRGRVQGVAYRAHTQVEARRRNLCGWVRNLPDGRVEIWAEGERGELEGLITWTHLGPPAARVEDVAVNWVEPTSQWLDFFISRRAAL